MLAVVTGCNSGLEERQMTIARSQKFEYAWAMDFEFRIVDDGEVFSIGYSVFIRTEPNHPRFNPFFTDLVFVHNEAQALEFPDNIVTAWPRGNFAGDFVSGINWAIKRTEDELKRVLNPQRPSQSPIRPVINLDDFDLTYPITVEDLVYKWEEIWRLWPLFTSGERSTIHSRPLALRVDYGE